MRSHCAEAGAKPPASRPAAMRALSYAQTSWLSAVHMKQPCEPAMRRSPRRPAAPRDVGLVGQHLPTWRALAA